MSRREHRDIVLVVDDSPDTLRMLTDALEQAGMTVLIARDGDQALSMIDRVTPDIVLMDAIMPGRDGFETCRELKRNKTLTHVPVIFMTGLSETDANFLQESPHHAMWPILSKFGRHLRVSNPFFP